MPNSPTTSAPLNDTRNNSFLQEYVYELLSSFYFPKNITKKLHAAASNLSSHNVLHKDGAKNQTIHFSKSPTHTFISSITSLPMVVSLTNDEKVAITSIKSSGERTARQTTVMLSEMTSEPNLDEDVTFAPKPFYKATIEKVTLKPKSKTFGIIQKTLSAALPESTYNIKISDRISKTNSTNEMKPQLMISDLFHNSLANDSTEENLILYDTDYVKWLFNIFYQEMKKKNLIAKVTYKKVHKVFLNMLAEIGSVRSKWLNKSMAKHYATHFERKRYDNEKRKTLNDKDLAFASNQIDNLLSQYFDPNIRVSSVPIKVPLKQPQVQNESPPSQYIDLKMNNLKSESKVEMTTKYPKITVEWSRPDRVQSILKDIRPFGGVSRNSGALPKVSFKNNTEKVAQQMEEYSMTKNAIARDIFRLIGSMSNVKDRNLSSTSASSSVIPPNSLNIESLPKDISQLLVSTIKRSKYNFQGHHAKNSI